MKKFYVSPEFAEILFMQEDVITASGDLTPVDPDTPENEYGWGTLK